MIGTLLVILLCCSISFVIGAAYGALSMRMRVAREMQRLDISAAVRRSQ